MGTRNGKSDQFDLTDLVVGVMAPEMFVDGFGVTEDFHCRFADKVWNNIADAFDAGQVVVVRVTPSEQLMALTALRYELGHADLQFRYDETNYRLFVRRKPEDEPATDEIERGSCRAHGRIEIDADLQCNTPPHSEHVAAGCRVPVYDPIDLPANHTWEIEASKFNFFGHHDGQKTRFAYAIVVDAGTRLIVGHAVGRSESTEILVSALRRAVSKHGAPRILRADLGKGVELTEFSGIVRDMKINLDPRTGRCGWQKGTVESIVNVIGNEFDPMFGKAWLGHNTESRVRGVDQWADDHVDDLKTIDEVDLMMGQYLDLLNGKRRMSHATTIDADNAPPSDDSANGNPDKSDCQTPANGATGMADGAQPAKAQSTRTADALPTLTVEYHDVGEIPTAKSVELRDSIDWFEARRQVLAGRAVSCRVAVQHLERAKSVLLDQLKYDNDDEDSWSACDWRYDLTTSTLWVWRSNHSPWSGDRGDVIASGGDESFQKFSRNPQPAGSATRGYAGACSGRG